MRQATPDPGSFRDPSSRVYVDETRVLRALAPDADRELDAVMRTEFFADAVACGQLIETTPIDDPPAELAGDSRWASVLEHAKLDPWTYPYEWSFSMLRDAARLQLELQRDALAQGFCCKDATPYNIQFDGSRPVFIDVGSFEKYREGDPWYGYLQFCQLFLFPLMLQAYADIPFQPLLRGSIEGISPELAWQLLGPTRLVRKGVPLHVALHARAQRHYADAKVDMKARLKSSGNRRSLVEANVKGLLRLVEGLEWRRADSAWSDYSDRGHYVPRDLAAKAAFVERAAGRRHHRLAWDIGCNDGFFSKRIAGNADSVVAFDSDHLVVDTLYRALRKDGPANITPLVMDLADPSPGVGWANGERRSFLERSAPDLVLALAVVHHLAITANVPTELFLDLLRSLDARAVIEFPTEHDRMVERLLQNKREGVHDRYTLPLFEAQLGERFDILEREELDTRVLFEVTPR